MLRFRQTTLAGLRRAQAVVSVPGPLWSSWRARSAIFLAVAATFALVVFGLPIGSRSASDCDLEVSSRDALTSAVQSTANSGKTICAQPGSYGGGSFVWTVDQPAMTRVVADPADGSISLPGSTFRGASNLTIEGFNVTSGSSVESNASHIRLVNNRFHDMSADVLDFHEGNADIWFVGNLVQNIRYTGGAFTGYGLQTFGGPTNGLHVNYNTFDMGGNSGDALQLGDVHDFEIVGNVIKNVTWAGAGGSDPHADAIMLWSGASRGLVKDNRITDSNDTLWSGSTTDVRMENNLIVRMKGLCHDGGTTGTSNAGLVRYQWVRNTIYDCGSFWNGGGAGGGYGLLSDGPASGNTLDRNLLTSLDVDTTAQFTSSNHNLIKNGARPGSTDQAFTPQFADTVDYKPTNLPAGYEDVGYRAAPAGYEAAPQDPPGGGGGSGGGGGATPPPPADTTPPTSTIDSGPNGSTTSTSATFAFSSSEPNSTFECKLDTGAFASCSSPKSYSGLDTGSHSFSVRATDAAGNTDPSPATRMWTIAPPADTTAPVTAIDSSPNGLTTATSASFAFSASEPGATFECQLDSGDYAACSSPKAYDGLAIGGHTFRVRAIDAAGNVDASPATAAWTILPPTDTGAPATAIVSGPNHATSATNASFAFDADDPDAVFECSLDSGAWEACTSPKAYDGLAAGSHTFSVRATDAAGNTDASPATESWTIDPDADSTPPGTAITSGPPDYTSASTASFTFVSRDPDPVFECSLDSGPWEPCASPTTYTDLAVGSHTFSVRATDAAGNTDPTPATDTWRIRYHRWWWPRSISE
jgi:hypothetical protein